MKIFKKILAIVMAFALVLTADGVMAQAAGKAIVVTSEAELNAALKSGEYSKITLSTDSAKTIKIEAGNYGKVNLVIDAPNATIRNRGKEGKIIIKAAKKFAEYSSGNTISIRADKTTFVTAAGAEVKTLGVAKKEAQVDITNKGSIGKVNVTKSADINLKQNGRLDKIYLNAETDLAVSGTSKQQTTVAVYEKAAGSTVDSAIAVKAVAYADAQISLSEGAENSSVTVKTDKAEVEVQNNTESAIKLTDSEKGVTKVSSGEEASVKGDEVTTVKDPTTPETTQAPAEPTKDAETPDVTPAVTPTSEPVTTYVPSSSTYVPVDNTPTIHRYTISSKAENASVKLYSAASAELTEGQYVREGSSVLIKAVPDEGYEITKVTIGETVLEKKQDGYYHIDSISSNTVVNVTAVKIIPYSLTAILSKDELSVDPDINDSITVTINVKDQFGRSMNDVLLTAVQDEESRNDTGIVTLDPITDGRLVILGKNINVTGSGDEITVKITCSLGEVTLGCNVSFNITDAKDPTFMSWEDYLANGGTDHEVQLADKALETYIKTRFCGKTMNDVLMLHDIYEIENLNISGKVTVGVQDGRPVQKTVEDLTGIENMVNLKNLVIIGQDIENCYSLKSLQRLEMLNISRNGKSAGALLDFGFPGSGSYNSLKTLIINDSAVKEFSFIIYMTNIVQLNLIKTGFSNVRILRTLNNLASLVITDEELTDISAIAELQNLRSLSINSNNISDYSPIYQLENLESIGLGISAKAEFSKLKNIATLTGVTIMNTIEDVSWLKDMTGLKKLSISPASYEPLDEILKNYDKIETLELYGCEIKDLSVIGSLTTLRSLALSDCGLTDISALANLTGLEDIDLSYNENITDISALLNNDEWTFINLSSIGMLDEEDIEALNNICPEVIYSPDLNRARISIRFDIGEHVEIESIIADQTGEEVDLDENGKCEISPDKTIIFKVKADEGYESLVYVDNESLNKIWLSDWSEDEYMVSAYDWGYATVTVKAVRDAVYTITDDDGKYLEKDDATTGTMVRTDSSKVFEALIMTEDGKYKALKDIEGAYVRSANENILIVMGKNASGGYSLTGVNSGSTRILIYDQQGNVLAACPVYVIDLAVAESEDIFIKFKLNNAEIQDFGYVATGGAIVGFLGDTTESVTCDRLDLTNLDISLLTEYNVRTMISRFRLKAIIVPYDLYTRYWALLTSTNASGNKIYVGIIKASR